MIFAEITDAPVIAILVALLSGGLLSTAWQIYQGRKRGPLEEQDLITKVSHEVMTGAADLLTEYKIQLDSAQRQIDTYLQQLSDLNRLLGEANARITRLELELDAAHADREELHKSVISATGDRESLRVELERAKERREALTIEIEKLRSQVNDLIKQLGG